MQNYRDTELTTSTVRNRGYVSSWGGANWLRRTAGILDWITGMEYWTTRMEYWNDLLHSAYCSAESDCTETLPG